MPTCHGKTSKWRNWRRSLPDPSIVAFIPAKSTSKRVLGKNVRELGGHPLLAWTIATARESGIFDDIVVVTDSEATAGIARRYGAYVPFLEPPEMVTETTPDIKWVKYFMDRNFTRDWTLPEAFSILRPTSPFRTAETIKRAWSEFKSHKNIDSIRAVEKCGQHPYKMWTVGENVEGQKRLAPLMGLMTCSTPYHSRQYQDLPEVWVQNASLEIAWTDTVLDQGSIAGRIVAPFFTEGNEGFDINVEADFEHAEMMLKRGDVAKPPFLNVPQIDGHEQLSGFSGRILRHTTASAGNITFLQAPEPFADVGMYAGAVGGWE
jgi:N-acylneuraminate cytidylyltransferase